MQNRILWLLTRLLMAAVLSLAFQSCGTKGKLYIPEQQYPQQTPAKK